MTFERFENWIKRNKFFSILLIILFVLGTFFQVSDSFVRIKSMLTKQPSPVLTEPSLKTSEYKILNFDDNGSFDYLPDAMEESHYAQGGSAYMIEHEEPVINGQLAGRLFDNSDNDIWLVHLSITDVQTPDGWKRFETGVPFTVSFDTGGLTRDRGNRLIEIHFPPVDENYEWSQYSRIDQTAEYGITKNTAFYRLTEFIPDRKLSFLKSYRAQYVVPEPEKAKAALSTLKLHNGF